MKSVITLIVIILCHLAYLQTDNNNLAAENHLHEVYQTLKSLHLATKNSSKGFFMIIDAREDGSYRQDVLNLIWDYADRFNDTLVLADKPTPNHFRAADAPNRLIEIQGTTYSPLNDNSVPFPPLNTQLIHGRSPMAEKPYDYKDHHSSQYNDDHPQEFQRVHEYNRQKKSWESYWVNAKDVDTWLKVNTIAKEYNRDDPRYLHFEVPDTRNALPIQPGHEDDRKNGKEFPFAESKIPEHRPSADTSRRLGKAPGANRKKTGSGAKKPPPVYKSPPEDLSSLGDSLWLNKQGNRHRESVSIQEKRPTASRKGSTTAQENTSAGGIKTSNTVQEKKLPEGTKKDSNAAQGTKIPESRSSLSSQAKPNNGRRPSTLKKSSYRVSVTAPGASGSGKTPSSEEPRSRTDARRHTPLSTGAGQEPPAYMSGREPLQRTETPEVVAASNSHINDPTWYLVLGGRLGKVHGDPSKRAGKVEKYNGEEDQSMTHSVENNTPLSSSITPLPRRVSRIHRRSSNFLAKIFGIKPYKDPDWQPVREWNYNTRTWDYYMLDSEVTDKWAKAAGYGNYNEEKPRTMNIIWSDQTSKKMKGKSKGTQGIICYFTMRC